MSTIYSPVLHVGSGQWMLGRIDDHVAKPLTRDEIDRLIVRLNRGEDGAAMIANERVRHVAVEGWTPEHDEQHTHGELTMAAASYAAAAGAQIRFGRREMSDILPPAQWPWEKEWWKLSNDPVRTLVKAGALLAAEIDRLVKKKGGAS